MHEQAPCGGFFGVAAKPSQTGSAAHSHTFLSRAAPLVDQSIDEPSNTNHISGSLSLSLAVLAHLQWSLGCCCDCGCCCVRVNEGRLLASSSRVYVTLQADHCTVTSERSFARWYGAPFHPLSTGHFSSLLLRLSSLPRLLAMIAVPVAANPNEVALPALTSGYIAGSSKRIH